jgi:voltage-gated potassium channel
MCPLVFGFSLNIIKLLKAIRLGIKADEDFCILLMTMLLLLIGGSYFYWQVEGWSVVDAIYFCFMTMSTIGYGDLVPTTAYSKIFTMVYAMLSIGVFVAIVTKLVMVIVSDKKASDERRRFKKRPDDISKDEH